MSLQVNTNIPLGNACGVHIQGDGEIPEVSFAADPRGGTEALWFCFQLKETQPVPREGGKVRLTMRHMDLWADSTATLPDPLPVYRPEGQGWHRVSSGELLMEPDGRYGMSWLIPHPTSVTDVALCFPYGLSDIQILESRAKGYWKRDIIGRSEGGEPLLRWANEYGSQSGRKQGLYLLAREWAGETPGSWVLDGFMQHIARIKRDPFVVWAVPFADPDAAKRGVHGKSAYPLDVDRAWGPVPARHETLVYQRDVERWRTLTKPALGLDFHAAPPADQQGVRCVMPSQERAPEVYRAADKWANVIQQELGSDYAAPEFKQMDAFSGQGPLQTFPQYFSETLGLCGLSILIPYARIGTKVLSQRHYREIGECIAKALLKKNG